MVKSAALIIVGAVSSGVTAAALVGAARETLNLDQVLRNLWKDTVDESVPSDMMMLIQSLDEGMGG